MGYIRNLLIERMRIAKLQAEASRLRITTQLTQTNSSISLVHSALPSLAGRSLSKTSMGTGMVRWRNKMHL